MKKTEASEDTKKESDDLLHEYAFDYCKARPNRFADSISKDQVTVVLDPDVAEVFRTSGAVNSVLRALITTMPKAKMRKPTQTQPPERKTG